MSNLNPYTTNELRDDLARAGARMSNRKLGSATFVLLEIAKLVNGVVNTTVYSNPDTSMTADERFTWASIALPNLIKTNPATSVQPIIIS